MKIKKDLNKAKNRIIDFIKVNKRTPTFHFVKPDKGIILEKELEIYTEIDRAFRIKYLAYMSEGKGFIKKEPYYYNYSLESLKEALDEIEEAENKYCVKKK